MKLILLPDIQETSDVPCDTGSDPEVLRKEIEEKGLPVDASLVTDGWNVKVRPFFFFFPGNFLYPSVPRFHILAPNTI